MKLAIKGHEKRGAEVIALLEMLGGINVDNLYGDDFYYYYYITDDKEIDAVVFKYSDDEACIFSLEEFEEKYPYKVGDRVIIKVNNQEAIIDKAVWCCDTIIYWLKYDDCLEGNWRTEHLRPYKEETMKEKIQTINLECGEFADKVGVMMGNYEVEVKDGITFFIKKQPQYPKTYEECCEVLRIPKNEHYIDIDAPLVPSDYNRLVSAFTKLLICRDAYWRIAGKQMGLGKPWKPHWKDFSTQKYSISIDKDEIITSYRVTGSRVLVFPTAEMRDTFYENFKDLIEQCKELL